MLKLDTNKNILINKKTVLCSIYEDYSAQDDVENLFYSLDEFEEPNTTRSVVDITAILTETKQLQKFTETVPNHLVDGEGNYAWLPIVNIRPENKQFFNAFSFFVIKQYVRKISEFNYSIFLLKSKEREYRFHLDSATKAITSLKKKLSTCTDSAHIELQLKPLLAKQARAKKAYDKLNTQKITKSPKELRKWAESLPKDEDTAYFKQVFLANLDLFGL